jgi:septal ring factor EnvC (AmiA/AmiB activator)
MMLCIIYWIANERGAMQVETTDLILSTLQEFKQEVLAEVSGLKHEMGNIKQEISTMKREIGAIKQEIGAMNQEIGAIKQEIGAMKQDISTMNQEIGAMKQDIGVMNKRLDRMEHNQERHGELLTQLLRITGEANGRVADVYQDMVDVKVDVTKLKQRQAELATGQIKAI